MSQTQPEISKVLVLSAHSGMLDRRIVAEMNTLVSSRRAVTFVSLPTEIPEAGLDPCVRVVMPSGSQVTSRAGLKALAKRLPFRLGAYAKVVWQLVGPKPVTAHRQYFSRMTPQNSYDVIHCHDLDTLPAGIELRAAMCPHAKLIYDSHELFPHQFPSGRQQRYWSKIESQSIRAADLVITVNESISRALSHFYAIDRPEVIYNSHGVLQKDDPLDEGAFLRHFAAPPGGFRVLFQGGMVAEKNLDALVRSFQILPESTQLFLLGGGPMEAPLRALCQRLELKNVFFGAWVEQERLLRYVKWAHMGVIPYLGEELLNNRYCTPNKLFEYIEAEIPICASDLPELRRIVQGYGLGSVYAMQDPESIAKAIAECRDRCLMGELTKAARRAARETFSWERQGTKLLALYNKLGV